MLTERPRDERISPRRLLSEEVACFWGEHHWSAVFADLSGSGAFIESSQLPPVGTALRLEFTLPFPKRGVRIRFKVHAAVIRCVDPQRNRHYLMPEGFSVRFANLTPKEKFCLEHFSLYEGLPTPTALTKSASA